ncbi:sugar ABC transporter ATP-binding protein [Agrobacterium fabacearum]|uniref:sugar ABC transporter ATP-binding protein n=1 Tax=Agrobacterium tumefaciens TaxID=358 RepID=UPI0028535873|nr:sugar ABC transporter ATP-binding protein [Agrobacterium tumefaciens]MDR5012557.1 sugar ABC transporter ATP-binding protein [Agrobacterium tumefaciens]
MSTAILLDRVTKSYGPNQALADATFQVKEGAVHALLGENGAGKSTLVKILSGIVRPDGGRIELFGVPVMFNDRKHSSAFGVETAFQEIPLIPDLTVADNLLLSRQPRKLGLLIDGRAARRRVEAIQAELEILDIDSRALVRELALSQRQKVEIARAISRSPRVLILDEPTASLSKADVDWLGHRIAQLKSNGTTIILVTHRMPEVHEFCSAMSILRNGRHINTHVVGSISDEQVFREIMGRPVNSTFPVRPAKSSEPTGAPLIETCDLKVGTKVKGVDLVVRPGEIVGVAALQGMGQLELFNALFGAERPSGGQIKIGGQEIAFASPADAIATGIGLVPEDRKIQGLALRRSGKENASLPVINAFSRFGLVNRPKEGASVDTVFAEVNLHPRALYQTPAEFSGGNQQKIVLAKWLLTQCHTLLVFDPTRGVDVGTKHEIYSLLRRFADAKQDDGGHGVLFHSTELPELIGVCDRIVVLYRGRVVAEVPHDQASEDKIGAMMLGANLQIRECNSW